MIDTIDEARTAIRRAIEKRPDLTNDGLDGHRRANFTERRAALLSETKGFAAAVAWLKAVPKRANVNNDHTSYGFKHGAERWAGVYVSNGIMIAAALHLGIKMRQCEGSEGINALFAIASCGRWPRSGVNT